MARESSADLFLWWLESWMLGNVSIFAETNMLFDHDGERENAGGSSL